MQHPEGEPLDDGWRALFAGGLIVTEHLRGDLAHALVLRRPPARRHPAMLTATELRVARARAAGASLKVLAFDLGRTQPAIAHTMARAMRKLHVRSQAELVALLLAGPSWGPSTGAPTGDRDEVRLAYPPPRWVVPRSVSDAERLVVNEALAGASHGAIARACGITSRTVANHLASVYRKLGVHSRIELFAALARQSHARPATPAAA